MNDPCLLFCLLVGIFYVYFHFRVFRLFHCFNEFISCFCCVFLTASFFVCTSVRLWCALYRCHFGQAIPSFDRLFMSLYRVLSHLSCNVLAAVFFACVILHFPPTVFSPFFSLVGLLLPPQVKPITDGDRASSCL